MERETGRSKATGFDVEKTAKRAENGTLPDNFNKWDAKTEKGETIAQIAFNNGKLPKSFNSIEHSDFIKYIGDKDNDIVFATEKSKKFFNVHVIFELKDDFRKNFPSAKWDSDLKCWQVKKIYLNRLSSWIETANSRSEKIKEEQEKKKFLQLDEKEKNRLLERLTYMESDIRQENLQKTSLVEKIQRKVDKQREVIDRLQREVVPLLKSKENDIISLKEQLQKEKEEKAKEINTAKHILEKSDIKVDDILDIASTMSLNNNRINSEKKERYRSAQKELYKIRDKFKSIGLKSKGINNLCDMNVNRPDRDNPEDITTEDILNIKQIEED